MKAKLEVALAWMKKWGAWIMGGLAALMGVVWVMQRQRAKLNRALGQAEAEKTLSKISALRAVRDSLAASAPHMEQELAEIDSKLISNKRTVVEALGTSQALTDEEVADAYKRLGY